jgi:hypothetical protein
VRHAFDPKIFDQLAVMVYRLKIGPCQPIWPIHPSGELKVPFIASSRVDQVTHFTEDNRMEKRRDPSHTRALLLAELAGMFHDAGLREMKTAFYKLDVELEKLLTASCTKPDDAKAVRKIFEDDLGVDRLGVGANRQDDGIHFAFPIVVAAGHKQAA